MSSETVFALGITLTNLTVLIVMSLILDKHKKAMRELRDYLENRK